MRALAAELLDLQTAACQRQEQIVDLLPRARQAQAGGCKQLQRPCAAPFGPIEAAAPDRYPIRQAEAAAEAEAVTEEAPAEAAAEEAPAAEATEEEKTEA